MLVKEKSESASFIGVGKDISYIQKDISEIKQSVKDLSGVYATQVKLDEISDKVKKLEESSSLWKWLAPILGAVVGSVLTFLLISYLQKL